MNRDPKGHRTVRLRTLLGLTVVFVLLIIAAGLWKFDFLHQQLRALLLGNDALVAERYGWRLAYAVDAVEFYEIEDTNRATNGLTIRIGTRVETHRVGPKKVLIADETKALMARWEKMRFHRDLSALCHEPAFVVRFLFAGKPILETTLCFQCQNFQAPSALGAILMGFDGQSPEGLAFRASVRSLFPESPKWAALERVREQNQKSNQ